MNYELMGELAKMIIDLQARYRAGEMDKDCVDFLNTIPNWAWDKVPTDGLIIAFSKKMDEII